MTEETVVALARLESLVTWYEKLHDGADMAKEYAAIECLRRELAKAPAVAAMYHEGIERIGGHCDVRG